jgi:hypothetical protein
MGGFLRSQAKQERPAAVTRKAGGNAESAPKFEDGVGLGYSAGPGRAYLQPERVAAPRRR